MTDLTVSKLAARAGVSADTIRYYERAALLPPAKRTASGYRLYPDEIADRLRFIKGAQRLGLRLREIRELLDVLDGGHCPCGHTERLLRQRVAEIDREMAQLRALERELVRVLDGLATRDMRAADRWRCEAEFIRAAETKEGTNGA